MTTITYENKSYTELRSNDPLSVLLRCKCGNKLIAPEALVVLGLTDSCGHCNREYARLNHESALLESYKSLIEDETLVEL